MIKIYLLDFSGAEADNFSTSALPSFVTETKNDTRRRESFFSYLLLSYAHYENFKVPMPLVVKDENGKPYFNNGEIYFNISHSDNLAAVIISDEGEVGIDVQKISQRVSERLIEKTLKEDLYIEKSESLTEPVFLKADNGKMIPFTPRVSGAAREDSFFRKWTEREALAKADGRGLSYIPKVNADDFALICEAEFEAFGSSYSLSAVKKK